MQPITLNFLKKHALLKSIACSVLASTTLLLATTSFADNLNQAVTPNTGLQNIANSPQLLDLLNKNKAEVLEKGQARLELNSSYFNFYKSDLHSHAVAVIDTLQNAGFEAYLVGGAVRDLLTGNTPKDYDVVTSAKPEQICELFNNSKIVSKRFKIVILAFDDEQIEVTTFRSAKNRGRNTEDHQINEDGMLIVDNDFSNSLADDSEHRDLTINDIYFDINKSKLIDFHGGIKDLQDRVLQTVGDAAASYRENPVAIIRILRFAAKLGFNIKESSAKPIKDIAPLLSKINKNRMFGEVNKLFLSGHSVESYTLLKQYDILKYLFPTLEQYLTKDNEPLLQALLKDMDIRHETHSHEESFSVYTYLLWPKFEQKYQKLAKKSFSVYSDEQNKLIQSIGEDILKTQMQATSFRENSYQSILKSWEMQADLMQIDSLSAMQDLASKDEFKVAFELFKIRSQFNESLKPYVTIWQPYYAEANKEGAK